MPCNVLLFFFFCYFKLLPIYAIVRECKENTCILICNQYFKRTFNCSSPRSWYKCEIPFSFEMSYCLLINTSFKPWYLVPSYSHWNSCWSLSSILALFRYLFFPIFNLLSCITIIYTVSQFISFQLIVRNTWNEEQRKGLKIAQRWGLIFY